MFVCCDKLKHQLSQFAIVCLCVCLSKSVVCVQVWCEPRYCRQVYTVPVAQLEYAGLDCRASCAR